MKNKLKIKFDLKKDYCFLLAPILVIAVMLVAFAIGGVFPFGSMTVDYYDMPQGIVPAYYHVWDALHSGDVSLWFNWNSGLGVNNATTSLSFFWLVLLVIPRTAIEKAMSIYVVMFFAGSSLTACCFLRKAEKVKPFWCTVLSLCYAFCGYSVMYYTNAWEDTVFLFPLFILSWLHLMKNGKAIPYIVMVILNLMCGYYVFTLTVFYVFFMSWIYLKLCVDKGIRKRRAWELGMATVLGFGLSSAFLVPKMVQTLSSERFVEKTGFDFSNIVSQYFDIAKTIHCKSNDKWAMLFACALPIALIIYGIIVKRKDKKTNGFFVSNIALLAVLIVCEGANALMHFGDYKYFPMRMGFALTFGIIWAAGHYSNCIKPYKVNLKPQNAKQTMALVMNVVCFVLLFGAVYLAIKKIDALSQFEYAYLYLTPVLAVIYFVLLIKKNRLFDYRLVSASLLAEVMILTMFFVPYWQTKNDEQEHSRSYITQSQKLAKSFDTGTSKTERIKTIGTTLNCNYGTVMGRAAVSDWTHLIPTDIQSAYKAFGYSGEYTRLHDSGGTAFTDALLGITNVMSVKDESSALYTKVDEANGYNYYSCNYTLPYGVVGDYDITALDYNGKNWITLNNDIYTLLSGDDGDIVTNASLKLKSKSSKTETYTFKSRANTTAYFKLTGAKCVKIKVDGKEQIVPSIDRESYAKYPGRLNRNLINLGEFGDSDVEIQLEFTEKKYEDKKDFRKNDAGKDAEKNQNFSVEVGLLDLNKLSAICDSVNNADVPQITDLTAKNYSLSANVNADKDHEVVVLPLQYNGGWSATVNGEKVQVMSAAGLFSAVKLEAGKNTVEMHFVSPGLKTGLTMTVCFIAAAIMIFVFRQRKIYASNAVCTVISWCYDAMFYIAVMLVYILPILYLGYWILRRVLKMF